MPKTKNHYFFHSLKLGPLPGIPSELIYHPSSSTTHLPFTFDIIFLLYHIQCITKSCPFYLPGVSRDIYFLLSLPPLPPLPIVSHMDTSLASEHPLYFLYIHSCPFQCVLYTLARAIISKYKTNHVTIHILFKKPHMSPCCSCDQDKPPYDSL